MTMRHLRVLTAPKNYRSVSWILDTNARSRKKMVKNCWSAVYWIAGAYSFIFSAVLYFSESFCSIFLCLYNRCYPNDHPILGMTSFRTRKYGLFIGSVCRYFNHNWMIKVTTDYLKNTLLHIFAHMGLKGFKKDFLSVTDTVYWLEEITLPLWTRTKQGTGSSVIKNPRL